MPLDGPPRRLKAGGSALADEVHALLSRAILDGSLAPGERLRDVDLAAKLGISRTPVREAMQRLEQQGLIEVSAHRYTRVTMMDASITAETVEYIGYLSGILLKMGLSRATDEEHAHLVELMDEAVTAAEDDVRSEAYMAMHRFYAALTRVTGNRLFIRVLRESGTTVQRFLAGWAPYADDRVARIESHRLLRDAVVARDGEAAELIVRRQHALI